MSPYIVPGLMYKEIKKLDCELIIDCVCEYFDTTHEVLRKPNRTRERVIARQLICYFVRKYTQKTLFEVGQLIGNRDHTTVIHSINTVNDFLDIKDRKFIKMIFDIEQLFVEKRKYATNKYQLTFN